MDSHPSLAVEAPGPSPVIAGGTPGQLKASAGAGALRVLVPAGIGHRLLAAVSGQLA
jgi:uncharacterized protein YjlB